MKSISLILIIIGLIGVINASWSSSSSSSESITLNIFNTNYGIQWNYTQVEISPSQCQVLVSQEVAIYDNLYFSILGFLQQIDQDSSLLVSYNRTTKSISQDFYDNDANDLVQKANVETSGVDYSTNGGTPWGYNPESNIGYVPGFIIGNNNAVSVCVMIFDFNSQSLSSQNFNTQDAVFFNPPAGAYDQPSETYYTLYTNTNNQDILITYSINQNTFTTSPITNNKYPGGDIVQLFISNGVLYVAKTFKQINMIIVSKVDLSGDSTTPVLTLHNRGLQGNFIPFVMDSYNNQLVIIDLPENQIGLDVFYLNFDTLKTTPTHLPTNCLPATAYVMAI